MALNRSTISPDSPALFGTGLRTWTAPSEGALGWVFGAAVSGLDAVVVEGVEGNKLLLWLLFGLVFLLLFAGSPGGFGGISGGVATEGFLATMGEPACCNSLWESFCCCFKSDFSSSDWIIAWFGPKIGTFLSSLFPISYIGMLDDMLGIIVSTTVEKDDKVWGGLGGMEGFWPPGITATPIFSAETAFPLFSEVRLDPLDNFAGSLLPLPLPLPLLLACWNLLHTWLSFFLLISWYNFKTSMTA